MKIAGLIITYLVGLVFVVFGIDYFFHFFPVPAMEGDAGKWVQILMDSKFMTIIKIMEIVFGMMLLANIKRPLAWLLLLPIIVGIAMFEVLIAKTPGIGIVLLILNFFMIFHYRDKYKDLHT